MRRTFKYRCYPTREQEQTLKDWLLLCRRLYNAMLEQRIDAWRRQRKSLSWFAQKRELPLLKGEFPEYAEIGSHVLQDVAHRVDRSFANFFRRLKDPMVPRGKKGFPQFQGRHRYLSLTFTDHAGWQLANGQFTVTGCGRVDVRWSRPVLGDIKTVTIKCTRSGKWYVCFSCDAVPARAYPETTKATGIDLGIKTLATTSSGEKLGDTHVLRRRLVRLRRLQRHMARQKEGGSRRSKTRVQVARLHEKVANQRQDMHHKVTTTLVRENALIVHEDISPRFMLANRHLARSASDAGWSEFLTMLQWKAAEAGRVVVAVPPKNTSQECSRCGRLVPKDLAQRVHRCPDCDLVLDRDHNAAMVILGRAQPKDGARWEPSELNSPVAAGAPRIPWL